MHAVRVVSQPVRAVARQQERPVEIDDVADAVLALHEDEAAGDDVLDQGLGAEGDGEAEDADPGQQRPDLDEGAEDHQQRDPGDGDQPDVVEEAGDGLGALLAEPLADEVRLVDLPLEAAGEDLEEPVGAEGEQDDQEDADAVGDEGGPVQGVQEFEVPDRLDLGGEGVSRLAQPAGHALSVRLVLPGEKGHHSRIRICVTRQPARSWASARNTVVRSGTLAPPARSVQRSSP